MAVRLKYVGPLEPVQWPTTGEEVAIRRPNLYASEVWDAQVAVHFDNAEKSGELRDGLVAFVARICPSKTVEQIREECSEEFLWLVANYSRDRLEEATELLGAVTAAAPAPALAQDIPVSAAPG